MELGNMFVSLGLAIDEFKAGASAVRAELADLVDSFNTAGSNIAGSFSTIDTMLSDLGSNLTSMGRSLGMVGLELSAVSAGIIELGTNLAETAGSMQKAQLGFENFSASAKEGDALLRQIYQMGLSSPFDVEKIVDAGRKLLAVGEDAKQITPLLKAAMDTVAATGAGQAGLDSLVRSFQRLDEEGVVTIRDIRNIAYQVPGAIQTLADAFNTSTTGIFKMAQQHMLEAGDVSTILIEGMQKKFGGFTDQIGTTLPGIFQQIKNQLFDTSNAVGTSLIPQFQAIEGAILNVIGDLKELAGWFAGLPEPVKDVAVSLALVTAAVGPLILGLSGVVLLIGKSIEAFGSIREAIGGIVAMTESIEAMGAITAVATTAAVLLGLAIASWAIYEAVQNITALNDQLQRLETMQLAGVQASQKQSESIAVLTKTIQDYNAQAVLTKQTQITLPDFSTFSASANGVQMYVDALKKLVLTIPQVNANMKESKTAFDSLASGGSIRLSAEALALVNDQFGKLSLGGKAVVDMQSNLEEAYKRAKAIFEELNADYKSGTELAGGYVVTQADVTRAQELMNKAFDALGPKIKKHKDDVLALIDPLENVTADVKKWEKTINEMPATFDQFQQALTTGFNVDKAITSLKKMQEQIIATGQQNTQVGSDFMKFGDSLISVYQKWESGNGTWTRTVQQGADVFHLVSAQQIADLALQGSGVQTLSQTFIDMDVAEMKAANTAAMHDQALQKLHTSGQLFSDILKQNTANMDMASIKSAVELEVLKSLASSGQLVTQELQHLSDTQATATINADAHAAAMKRLADSAEYAREKFSELADQQTVSDASWKIAVGVYNDAKAALDGSATSIYNLERAYTALKSAFDAAHPGFSSSKVSLDQLTGAADLSAGALQHLAGLAGAYGSFSSSVVSSNQAMASSLHDLTNDLEAGMTAFDSFFHSSQGPSIGKMVSLSDAQTGKATPAVGDILAIDYSSTLGPLGTKISTWTQEMIDNLPQNVAKRQSSSGTSSSSTTQTSTKTTTAASASTAAPTTANLDAAVASLTAAYQNNQLSAMDLATEIATLTNSGQGATDQTKLLQSQLDLLNTTIASQKTQIDQLVAALGSSDTAAASASAALYGVGQATGAATAAVSTFSAAAQQFPVTQTNAMASALTTVGAAIMAVGAMAVSTTYELSDALTRQELLKTASSLLNSNSSLTAANFGNMTNSQLQAWISAATAQLTGPQIRGANANTLGQLPGVGGPNIQQQLTNLTNGLTAMGGIPVDSTQPGTILNLNVNVNNADATKVANQMIQTWRQAGVPI